MMFRRFRDPDVVLGVSLPWAAIYCLLGWAALSDRLAEAADQDVKASAISTLGDPPPKPETIDPLPSWNEGPTKAAILDFVARTTRQGSSDFVPVLDRIAVFDNDGTLWPENPTPFEVAFALDSAEAMLVRNPALRGKPAYQAAAAGDVGALTANHLKLLVEIILDTHSGQTVDEYRRTVADWIATARHPRFHRPYSECTYLPMQELLRLLRAKGYRTYIVSGGSADFMRVWSERIYGIPPDQVIGTVFKTRYDLKDDRPTLMLLPEISHIDDRAGKPVAIHHCLGRKPIFCCGNSDGDHEMLQYTTIGRRPSFGLIVHHTDPEREYAYDASPKSSGKLVEALTAAPRRGWAVVDMKSDWKYIFMRPVSQE